MSRAEQTRFKSTVLDGEWTVAPAPAPAGTADEPPTELALWSPVPVDAMAPSVAAIVRPARASPVLVVQEVELPPVIDSRLVVLHDPTSPQARRYRLLHHQLIAHSDPRVIAVTSAWPEEGKTTCAANLALTLADETLARVLLLEANLPRPGLAMMLGFIPEHSVVGRIVQHRDPSPPYLVAAICETRLQVAALGPQAIPRARLDRWLFGTVIRELRTAYDYVIIDAASVLESADADVASECADAVILSACAGKSRKSSVRRALDGLGRARVCGVVLLDT